MKKFIISITVLFLSFFVIFPTIHRDYQEEKNKPITNYEYIEEIKEKISMTSGDENIETVLTESIYGPKVVEYVTFLDIDEVSGNILTDRKSFVTILPYPDFLDNQNYYYKEGNLVAYKEEFMGIGGSVTYYFRDNELIYVDDTNVEEEMIFESENPELILKRARNVHEQFIK